MNNNESNLLINRRYTFNETIFNFHYIVTCVVFINSKHGMTFSVSGFY